MTQMKMAGQSCYGHADLVEEVWHDPELVALASF